MQPNKMVNISLLKLRAVQTGCYVRSTCCGPHWRYMARLCRSNMVSPTCTCVQAGESGTLTLSYIVVTILVVAGILLIWVPLYLVVMVCMHMRGCWRILMSSSACFPRFQVVFAIMVRGYYADPTPIMTAMKNLYDSIPLADFTRIDE